MKYHLSFQTVTRRHALALIGGTVATLAAIPALGDANALAEHVKSLTGGATVAEGGITLDMPEIAENGNAVKVAFDIDSPMTDADYVRAVHIMADGNPTPEVASFFFTPANGSCAASTRMRLATTQNVIVLAEMSNGSFKQAQTTVKVTIGGCGG